MKITILDFSPSGNTRDASRRIAEEIRSRGMECQSVHLAGSEDAFLRGDWGSVLERDVGPHDLLLVGGPVYAHHLHYNVQDLIRALPRPDGRWGRLVIPFVTYGGISSGVALAEAGKLLKRSGRTVVAGLKLAASHRMTRAFMDREFNADLPRDGADTAIRSLVDRISALRHVRDPKDVAGKLTYANFATRLKARFVFQERTWQRKGYPEVVLDRDACTGCGACVKSCPVLRLRKGVDGKVEERGAECIHCLNCVSVCPRGAIGLAGDIERGRSFMGSMIAKHGNKEAPASAVYPRRENRLLSGNGRIGNLIFGRMLDALDTDTRSGVGPEEALRIAGVGRAERILELGCGSGYYTRVAHSVMGPRARYTALDIHPMAVERTRSRLPPAADGRIEVHRGDALQTGLDDASFDLVLLLGVLPSPFLPLEVLFPEAMRLLQIGGELAVWTLDRFWKHSRIARYGLEHLESRNGIHRYRKLGGGTR